MRIFFFVLYNLIFLPLFFLFGKIAGFFNSKIRQGIRGRKNLFGNLKYNLSRIRSREFTVWIHVSSMGEYEQGKPVIRTILDKHPQSCIVVSFFSPSGYENVDIHDHRVIKTYLPIDFYWNVKRFLKIVKPAAALVIRHDYWFNFQWCLKSVGIPSFLIDASISDEKVATYNRFSVYFRNIWATFTNIFVVSEVNVKRLQTIYPGGKYIVAGDTRFDQVFQRAIEVGKIDILLRSGHFKREKTIVAGSTWPGDEKKLLPAVQRNLRTDKYLKLIIAPHEVTSSHLDDIEQYFHKHKISIQRYSQIGALPWRFRVLLIDRYGILANLYALGYLAYVGGGFGLGVNSVLEPAAHGCFVVFGPRYKNVLEARQLVERSGAAVVKKEIDMVKVFKHFTLQPQDFIQMGENASLLVKDSIGASEKILSVLEPYFFSNKKNVTSGSIYG